MAAFEIRALYCARNNDCQSHSRHHLYLGWTQMKTEDVSVVRGTAREQIFLYALVIISNTQYIRRLCRSLTPVTLDLVWVVCFVNLYFPKTTICA